MPAWDWYSLDKRQNSLAAWFVSIQDRIVLLRALGRPEPPTLGSYTGTCVIGRQRGLQAALGAHVPLWASARIHARVRDSTHREICLEALSVLCIMCLDTACVSKATN